MNMMVGVSCLLGRVLFSVSRETPLLAISLPQANIPIKNPPISPSALGFSKVTLVLKGVGFLK